MIASKPGPGYTTLMAAVNKYVDTDLSTVPTITGGSGANAYNQTKRRSLVTDGIDVRLLPYCQSIPGDPCGIMFNILARSDGSKYAVLKLTTFENVDFVSTLLPVWSTLIEWAVGNQTDSLIIDLLGNGGGWVSTAYALAVALFNPEPNTTYPFFNQYDRRVGPAAQFFLNDGLYLSNIQRTLKELATNETWIAERIATLNSNSNTVPSLISDTERMIQAVNILISDNKKASPCFLPTGIEYDDCAGQECRDCERDSSL